MLAVWFFCSMRYRLIKGWPGGSPGGWAQLGVSVGVSWFFSMRCFQGASLISSEHRGLKAAFWSVAEGVAAWEAQRHAGKD